MQGLLAQISRYRKQTGIYFFMCALAACAVLFAAAGHRTIYAQLNDWKLIPRPERMTELYFTQHQQLPDTYQAGSQQTIAFAVRNLEHRSTTYAYTITQDAEEPKTIARLAAGTFQLGHNQTKRVSLPATLVDQGSHSRIAVTITYTGIAFGQDMPSPQSQSIYYQVTQQGVAQ